MGELRWRRIGWKLSGLDGGLAGSLFSEFLVCGFARSHDGGERDAMTWHVTPIR